MVAETAIEMFVGGLVLDPNTQTPVVVLKDETGQVALPIWIGIAEATSIASVIKQLTMQRPLTHDLMYEALNQLGAVVQRVMITELKDSTYFSELILSVGDRAMILDSRPSDAIAIALRAQAPIYVAQKVIDQAKMSFNFGPIESGGVGQQEPIVPEGGGDGNEQTPPAEGAPEQDFKNVDKGKWRDILDDLDPDDFKYKM